MAEAVGLVASTAGLIDVTTKLISFANTAKNIHKEEQDFILEATNSLGPLFRLKQRLEDPSTELTSAVKSDTAAIKEDTTLIKPIKEEVSRIASHTGTAVDAARQQRIDKIMCFMAPYDFGSKLSDVRSSRVPETGTWFVESPEFQEWVHSEGNILWCQGIPGAGKTILVTTTIDHLRHKFQPQNRTQIIYASCDYKHRGEQDVRTMLASLWKQLARSRVFDTEECEIFEPAYLKPDVKPAKDEILTILRDEIAQIFPPELQYAMSVVPEENDGSGEEDLVPGDVIVSVCAGLVSVDSSNLVIGNEVDEFIGNNPLLGYASANWGHHARQSFRLCRPLIHPKFGREARNWQNSSPQNDIEACSSSVCNKLEDTIKGFTTLNDQFLCAFYVLLHMVFEDPRYSFEYDLRMSLKVRRNASGWEFA
ncbi:hypothetical protein DL766_010150 [Monosporascus sp. MC13-8B]|uniref:Nephrocystin 3-like N-terminal domain-containing protein n=1 Tax=Monosporascus cannonballus TaxID=155416 RepID=A0ABY0GZQ0_9PEZI|nr:hypothetical protein DL762_007258 [Monosporascus cannonballus]RYO84826.1 hypothetical protein DL763_007336 [Monosporascus cannonballus]RYP09283.1 hypothetical protein DL766_010150 [Monosporascus sp. MC13-8B]